MLTLSSLGLLIIKLKNGLLVLGLCLSVHVRATEFGFLFEPLLFLWSPSVSWLKLAQGKCETIRGKLPHGAHKWKGKCSHALKGRSLAVCEQQPADGCEAEMIHTDSAMPVSVPLKDRWWRGVSAAA